MLRLTPKPGLARPFVVALALALSLVLAGGAGTASAAEQVISSAGPLTNIYLAEDLACQVDHVGDTSHEFFPPSTTPGDCGTFIWAGGEQTAANVYGHKGFADINPRLPYTPVSQTAVTGTGTNVDPFKVVTVVDVGSTGLRITQTDTYVVGNEFYRSDIEVKNSTSSDIPASLYHAGDCFLQNSDFGYGFYDASAGGIYCSVNPNNTPTGRIEGFAPQSPGSNYYESTYFNVWNAITGVPFPNTCDCETREDNGSGLSWSVTVPANGSVTRSLLSNFSPLGKTPAQIATNLTGEGKSGEKITVKEGTAVTDNATLTGTNVGTATGTVSYKVYSDNLCTAQVADAGTVTVTGGSVPPSKPETLPPGTYYWQASYSGDGSHEAASTKCGEEVLTVEGASCTTVIGSGQFRVGGEIQTVDNEVTTSGSKHVFEYAWEGRAQHLRLTKLETASCSKSATESKFTGHGKANVNGVKGYEITFTFTIAGGKTNLVLVLEKGGVVVRTFNDEPLIVTKLQRERIF
jgi:hypothetical protein